jgi:urease accessory protein
MLDAGAHFAGWEIACLGRDAAGFASGELVQRWRIEREGRVVWAERAAFEGGGELARAPWGLAGRPVTGTFVATGAAAEHVEALRERAPADARDWQSATRLGEVLVCRYLGYSADGAKRFFCEAWDLLRRHLTGRKAVAPRVWAT